MLQLVGRGHPLSSEEKSVVGYNKKCFARFL
jgi:hypothetical protein